MQIDCFKGRSVEYLRRYKFAVRYYDKNIGIKFYDFLKERVFFKTFRLQDRDVQFKRGFFCMRRRQDIVSAGRLVRLRYDEAYFMIYAQSLNAVRGYIGGSPETYPHIQESVLFSFLILFNSDLNSLRTCCSIWSIKRTPSRWSISC